MIITNDQNRPVFLPHILAWRDRIANDLWSLTFLDSQGREQCCWRASDLAAKARAIAARLERETAPGEPVLLVFQPGVDFLAGFMGCLWSGRLATPINPPRRNRLIERLVAVATDSGARVALTAADLLGAVDEWRHSSERLGDLRWIAVETLPEEPDLAPAATAADDIAFIQYTSGSTALPKGVMVSHANLIEDMARMEAVWGLDSRATMVSWLPAFHDLGLIFGLLQPLYSGCAAVQMAPNTFLQKPALWLSAVSRYGGTHSAAPSFAYDLCCRRIASEDRVDLSSLVMTMNAAEPINPAVMDRFTEEFQPFGFRREAFAPAYGLAESTLAVTANRTGAAPVVRCFDVDALKAGRVVVLADGAAAGRAMPGSGRPLAGVPIAIVDPETRRRCRPDRIGEIWVGGPTVARGYWRRPEETGATFGATIDGEDSAGPFLRTGDLGTLLDGELFVTGRIKDLIILGGTNFYPHDIERVAQHAHDALRRDNGAAFSIVDDSDGGREQVVLVQELERTRRADDPAPIFQAIVEAVWQSLELAVSRIVLVSPGTVLRTSSGKIQRLANRRAYLDGALSVIAQWQGQTAPALRPVPASERDPIRSDHDPAAIAAAAKRGARPARAERLEHFSTWSENALTVEATALAVWLTGWLADRLNLPAATLDADRGFAEMGLDSIGSTELAFALGDRIGADLPETIAYDYPTIARLVAHVAALGRPAPPPVAPVPAPARPGTDLDDLLTAIERGEA